MPVTPQGATANISDGGNTSAPSTINPSDSQHKISAVASVKKEESDVDEPQEKDPSGSAKASAPNNGEDFDADVYSQVTQPNEDEDVGEAPSNNLMQFRNELKRSREEIKRKDDELKKKDEEIKRLKDVVKRLVS